MKLSILEFQKNKVLQSNLEDGIVEALKLKTSIKLSKTPLFSIIEKVEPISATSIDLHGFSLLEELTESFTTLYVVEENRFYKYFDLNYKIGFFRVSWQTFFNNYRVKYPTASELTITKDFIRASNEYCSIMAENYKYKYELKDFDNLKIYPLIIIEERPPIINPGELTRNLRVLFENQSVAAPQLIYTGESNEFNIALIKAALALVRAVFFVKGLNLRTNLKSSIKKIFQNFEKPSDD